MKATIVGMGLIGGSLSKDLKSRKIIDYVIGIETNNENAKDALHLKLADEIKPLEEALNVDLIFLCVPVDVIEQILPFILDNVKAKTVVMDMGSTKEQICELVRNHKNRKQFVAAHPIAGLENAGPLAAIDKLFDNKVAIICEKELSSNNAIEVAEKIFSTLKMRLVYMNAEDHDKHMAYISHLSHVISYALANTVLNIESNNTTIFDLAGSGFASTVRLAKSSPEMWTPIFTKNSTHILTALEEYIQQLQQFKSALKDENELHDFISSANRIRKVLQKA
ncbi:MAG: prephenate dehydrogenase [Bacteroidia bacterium]